MKKVESDNLRELLWRSRLTAEKEAQLQALRAGQPEAEAEEELRLNQFLNQLPDAPIASNFTSQVLRAIELEEVKISREHKRGWPARRVGFGWVSRLAVAGFCAFVGLLAINHHQFSKRVQLAHNIEQVTRVAALPTEWLENFETINQLSQTAPVDEELLAMLK
jgi:hypothetical protein